MGSDKSVIEMYISLYNSGQVSEEEVEEADFTRNFSNLSRRISGNLIDFIAKRIEIVETLCDSRDKKLVVLRAYEHAASSSTDVGSLFHEALSKFAHIVEVFPSSSCWMVENSLKNQFENHVIAVFRQLVPPRRELTTQVVLLDHRLAALNRRSASPLLAAIIDTIPMQGRSLVRLASFLEWVSTHDQIPDRSLIIETAFRMASQLGIRLLAQKGAVLLPGFSTETIIAVRKIISSFIHFNGPSEWAEYSLSSVIAEVMDQEDEEICLKKLTQIVKMLSYLRQPLSISASPIVTPGSLVSEFLHKGGPTKYALIAHDVLMYHPLPSSFVDRFNNFRVILSEFIGFPNRFYRMAERIGFISSIHRGNVPTHIMDSALSLPRHLAKTEPNLDRKLSPQASLLVEGSVFAYFELIAAVAENRFSSPQAVSHRLALERCSTARENLQSQLYSTEAILDSSLLDSAESLISEILQISHEIRSPGSFQLVFYC
jgi:hypothetical protein